MRRRLTLFFAALALVSVGALAFLALQISGNAPQIVGSPGIALARPVIADGDGSFLDQEAGIAAYTKIGASIDLNAAVTSFRVIERQTSEWIIGTVAIFGEQEDADPHVFVHVSGWIVAYYDRDIPISTALHWVGSTLGTSHLEQVLGDVAASAGAPLTTIGHFNFRFPDANQWLTVVDTDTFDLTIPQEIAVFERSYAFTASDSSCGSSSTATLAIDGVTIRQATVCGSTARVYGSLSVVQLLPSILHNISVSGANARSVAISLLFKAG